MWLLAFAAEMTARRALAAAQRLLLREPPESSAAVAATVINWPVYISADVPDGPVGWFG